MNHWNGGDGVHTLNDRLTTYWTGSKQEDERLRQAVRAIQVRYDCHEITAATAAAEIAAAQGDHVVACRVLNRNYLGGI
jgi:hypothetical protein